VRSHKQHGIVSSPRVFKRNLKLCRLHTTPQTSAPLLKQKRPVPVAHEACVFVCVTVCVCVCVYHTRPSSTAKEANIASNVSVTCDGILLVTLTFGRLGARSSAAAVLLHRDPCASRAAVHTVPPTRSRYTRPRTPRGARERVVADPPPVTASPPAVGRNFAAQASEQRADREGDRRASCRSLF